MKMELTKEFKEMLYGEMIMVPRYTFAQEESFKDSPLANTLKVDLGLQKGLCSSCDSQKFDSCSNCERAMCKSHAYPIMLRAGTLIINVCWECRELLIQLGAKHKA